MSSVCYGCYACDGSKMGGRENSSAALSMSTNLIGELGNSFAIWCLSVVHTGPTLMGWVR